MERELKSGNSWGDATQFVAGPNAVDLTDVVSKKGLYRYRVQAFNASGESASR